MLPLIVLSFIFKSLLTLSLATKPISDICFPTDFDPARSCILCDLDGTLLSGHHGVSSDNLAAIKESIAEGFHFIPATGRTRVSMRNAVGQDFVNQLFGGLHKTPGIYQQGLMVFGLDGELIYERSLPSDVITVVSQYCRERGLSVVAYSADQIFCEQRTELTDLVTAYKDPLPTEFPAGLDRLQDSGVTVHKLIILSAPDGIPAIRAGVEPMLEGLASVTQAVPEMLEVLPLGGCKGDGVRRFLEHIGVKPADAIAFGGTTTLLFRFFELMMYFRWGERYRGTSLHLFASGNSHSL